MKKLLSVLLTTAMLLVLIVPFSVHAAINPSDYAYAPYADAESLPVLDGEVDDVYLTAPEYVLGRVVKGDSTNAGKRDTSTVKFRLVHHASYIYFMVDIVDDALISKQSDTHWKNDCLMIFFSEDGNATGFGDNGLSYQPYVLLENTPEPQHLNTRNSKVSLGEESQYFCKTGI